MTLQKNSLILRIKILIILMLCCSYAHAEDVDSLSVSQRLESLFSRLIVEREDSSRLKINDSIKIIVEEIVEIDSIFKFNFKNIRFLGQITSTDSIIKIVSWNLNLKNERGRYFCYMIKKNEPDERNSIYKLTAEYDSTSISIDTIYTDKNWYGALYYEIRPLVLNGAKCWILLGINYGNPLITRKIIDVITFKQNGEMTFGSPVFLSLEKFEPRAVFQYSVDATMTLRFANDSTIAFDHLVPFSPDFEGQMEYYGPDYSYDAYTFENGIWTFVRDIDARNEEKPMMIPLR